MPYAKAVTLAKSDGRIVPPRCKICRLEQSLRRLIEDSHEEGITPGGIAGMLRGLPYEYVTSPNTIRRHVKEHKFLRHIEDEQVAKNGGDPEAERAIKEFVNRDTIMWHGPYSVPSELLEMTFDPVKRLQELFYVQYTRFIKMIKHENQDGVTLRETRQLGGELRDILLSLWKVQGNVSEDGEVKEAAITMILIKVLDRVAPAMRQDLIELLDINDDEEFSLLPTD